MAEAVKTGGERWIGPISYFALVSLDGKPTKLGDFRGRAIFLTFFATWCPPCRAAMPDVRSTYEENKDGIIRHVQIGALSKTLMQSRLEKAMQAGTN